MFTNDAMTFAVKTLPATVDSK